MALYIARHGETDWNREKRFQSHTDVPLNDTGLAQAKRLRHYVEAGGLEFERVFCSPLVRARDTAEIITGDGAQVVVDERLIELSLGDFEGRAEQALRDELGDDFDHWRAQCFLQPAPGGEALHEAMQRVGGLLGEFDAASGHCLVVAHQGINMALMATISGRTDLPSLADFKQRNDQFEIWDVAAGRRIERVDI